MQNEIKNNIYLNDDENSAVTKDEYDYSKFSDIEGFVLDEELKKKFAPIAKKLNLSQDSVEMLLDIALEMSKKQEAYYKKDEETKQNEIIASYNKLFNNDKEIPNQNSQNIQEYMKIANSAYKQFCTPELKEVLKETNLVYHPELIKMFFKIGELTQEDEINYGGKPAFETLTPAQILYGTGEK